MTLPQNVSYDAKDNILRYRVTGSFKGLDTTSGLTDMDPRSLRVADNTNIDEQGTLSKRKGIKQLLAAGLRYYQGGIEYRNASGVKLLVASKLVGANTGELSSVNAAFAGLTSIISGLSVLRPSLVQFNNLIFYYNGVDDFLYDGTATRQIGITPPAIAPTFNSNIAGGLVVGGSYLWAYTYYNSVTGAESSPSPIIATAVVVAVGGTKINITAGAATTADTIRVYRTTANGAVLFLDGSTGIASTTYDSIIGDAGLGKQIEIDNTRPSVWGKFKYAANVENRVYLTGLASNTSRAWVSAIYSEGPHPESFPAKNFVDCQSSRGASDYNIGFGVAGNTVIVKKRFSVGRIEKVGIDSNITSDDPVVFTYREISRSTTALSHHAGCNVYGEWLWLGTDNIYATDGNQVRTIGDSIRKTIRDLGLNASDKFSAYNDSFNKRVYFTASSTSNGNPDWVIVGYYKDYPDFYWTIYKPGISSSTHYGIRAGCIFGATDFDGVQKVIIGNSDYLGQLWWADQGDKDEVANSNAQNIYWYVQFPPVSYGLEEEEKFFFKDRILVQGNGSAYNLSAESLYDLVAQPIETQLISMGGGIFLWLGGLWLGDFWNAGAIPITVDHDTGIKAYRKQLQLYQTEKDAPVTIWGYETMARPTYFRG